MKRYSSQLHRETWIQQPRDRVFRFFADPANLELLTPRWLAFSMCSPPPADLRPGSLIDYRLRLHAIPLRWRSEITLLEPPYRFVDSQLQGPYRSSQHEHCFVDTGDGTRVVDHVCYSVPGGRWIERWLVAPDLARIFDYRQDRLKELFA